PLFPEPASTTAVRVDEVFLFSLVILLFFTTLICVLILTFAVRYRRGARVDRSHPPVTNLKIEMLWIGIPLLISIALYAWATNVFFEMYDPPANAAPIYVTGKQ